MSTIRSIGTAVTALALGISVPMTSAAAATRPGSAVPTAASVSSTSSAAQAGNAHAFPWLPVGIIAITVGFGVWIATKNSSNGPISRA